MEKQHSTSPNSHAVADSAKSFSPVTNSSTRSGGGKSKSSGAKTRAHKASKSRSSETALKIPKWVATGASVTGALVVVGATLFATREEWLPRAKKLGGTLTKSFGGRDAQSNDKGSFDNSFPIAAPHFEPSGAEAGFAVSSAT